MKATEFITYEDANDGKVIEFGVKSFVMDKMIREVETYQSKVAPLISDTVAKSLCRFLTGNMLKMPPKLTINCVKERDACLRGFEYFFMIEGARFACPDEYVVKAYESWSAIKGELLDWQKRSLWQYISYWFRRDWRPVLESLVAHLKPRANEEDY